MDHLRMLLQIALRNLFASRMKTAIVGGIIFMGTLIVVVGGSLVDSVADGMSRSIIGSAAGHLQLYSAKSKDDLALFGGMGGDPDIAPTEDFEKIQEVALKNPNVAAVVPMGINGAMVTSGNTIDLALASLRTLENRVRAGEAETAATEPGGPTLKEEIEAKKAHVHRMVEVLLGDQANLTKLVDAKAINQEALADLKKGASAAFWESFDQDPLGSLEFLENKVAPQATDADLLWIRYVGTDLDKFQKSFDRMQIVDGTMVPQGQRGYLIPKVFYEERVKLKNARRLDKLLEAVTEKRQKIAERDELKRLVKENVSQVREILLQLDPIKAKTATERLQKVLGSQEGDLTKLLEKFFETTDENIAARHEAFYAELAPLLELYRIRVGDTLTIKAFTKSGYMQSVNVKVYGTFDFKGLEKSALAGALGLMDLMSFRELYGFLTEEKKAEIEQLKKESGAKAVDRASAEEELFGSGRDIVAEATPGLIDEAKDLSGAAEQIRREETASRVYTQKEIDEGVVLNAAVMLKDPERLVQTQKELEQSFEGAKLGVKVVSWQKASGLIGQFVLLLKAILYVAVLIIFVVALVIINNALVMATLERVREFGTMRAIGAQRRFILVMLFIEAVVVGAVFGTLGAVAGAAIITVLGNVGIPAVSDVMWFFFSGPRLLPFVSIPNLIAAFVIVTVVSTLSGFYPAWLAMKVSPMQAMQADD